MPKHDLLTKALDELRQTPGTDLPTLNKVDDVLKKLAGTRLTLKKGSKRKRRIEQAQALVTPAMTQQEAISAVCKAIGCSRSSGWRFVRDLRSDQRIKG